MAKMDWRKAALAGKPTGDRLDGGLRKEPQTKGQKRRAKEREKKKLYGFFKDRKPTRVKKIDPNSDEGRKIIEGLAK